MLLQLELHLADLFELIEEPRIDAGHLGQLFYREPLAQGIAQVINALRMRRNQSLRKNFRLDLAGARTLAGFERPDSLHQRLFEGTADGHRLTDRLHLWAEAFISAGKFLKLPFGD